MEAASKMVITVWAIDILEPKEITEPDRYRGPGNQREPKRCGQRRARGQEAPSPGIVENRQRVDDFAKDDLLPSVWGSSNRPSRQISMC